MHEIDFKPKNQRPYRLPPDKKEALREHLDELLRQNIIAPVSETEDVPIISPIVLVSKQDRNKKQENSQNSSAKYRFCCDFRYLNSQVQDFSYFIPDLTELTESFSGKTPNYLASIDLSSGFFQMPVDKDSQKYTAFNTCFGTFIFRRLSMGLSSAPSSFQLLMDKILQGLTFKVCLCYLDDILIASETFDQHIDDLNTVFGRLKEAGLKLGPKKCSFAQQSCVFLGHLISSKGIQPPPERLQAIKDYPSPKSVKELRRVVGLLNWFRKYIPNFSSEIEPMTKLLRKNMKFRWSAEQENAFQKLKKLLLNSPVLAFPNYNIPFHLAVDTSSKGIGYVLYQIHTDEHEEDMIRVVRFGSKSLSRWQISYGPTKLELLGMVTAILDCSVYLRGRRFIVECDHQALKPLFQKQLKGAIYERWIAILQQYNFDLRYKPARDMQVADALSRIPRQDISDGFISPDIEDPYFPYKEEIVGDINIEGGYKFPSFKHSDSSENDQINNIRVDQNLTSNFNLLNPDHQHKPDLQTTAEYDADTEDDVPGKQNKLKRKIVLKRKLLSIPNLRINPSENNPVSVNKTDIESVSDNDMKQNIEIQNPTNTVDTDISVPSTDRSSDDQSTVLNEHDSDIFNLTTDVNTDQDNQMRRQVEMIDLFERSDF
ncbi:unnamed protein product [Mytilus coruscus]|uniref:Reverse transcriptase domain-containing protein n=1 Tax=Mytilus coruscus TaxID=42192 RepID=A0A6J8BZ07_MYTCO|nr:unnamed protein product [Mytilus coruscus]